MEESCLFVVLEGKYMSTCCIIGTNILSYYKIDIDFGNDALLRNGEKIATFENPSIDNHPIARVNMVEFRPEVVLPEAEERLGDLEDFQRRDPEMKRLIIAIARRTPLPKELTQFRRAIKDLVIINGVILHAKYNAIVVPFEFLVGYYLETHKNNAHIGKHKMIQFIKFH